MPTAPALRTVVRWLWRRADDTLDALTCGPVMTGVVGSLLMVLGSLTPAFLPRAAQGGDLIRWPWAGTLVLLLGAVLMLGSWLALRPGVTAEAVGRKGRRPRHAAVLILWAAPLVCGPPILSGDAYAYAAQGWMVAHGLDPYQMGPGSLPSSWADQVDPIWLETPTPYGPLSLTLQYVMVAVVGDNSPYLAAWGMRLWALIGVALLAWAVPRVAQHLGRDAKVATWLGVLNPIVLFHFVGGSHNDSLMMGFLAVALWLACRRHLFVAAVFVGLAAGMKQPAAMAVVAITVLAMNPVAEPAEKVRAWPRWPQLWRCVVALVVVVATFVACSVFTGVGFGWVAAAGVPGAAITASPSTQIGSLLSALLFNLGWNAASAAVLEIVRTVCLVGAALILAWLCLRVAAVKPMTFLVGGLFALVILGPALHAWYLLWPGVFVGLLPRSRPIWWLAVFGTVFWTIFAVGDVAIRDHVGWLAVFCAVVIAAVAVWSLRIEMRELLAERRVAVKR